MCSKVSRSLLVLPIVSPEYERRGSSAKGAINYLGQVGCQFVIFTH